MFMKLLPSSFNPSDTETDKMPSHGLRSIFRSSQTSSGRTRQSSATQSMSILLPLYIFPSPGAWDILYKSIGANPQVLFNIVVNPDSGPGASIYPEPLYIDGIARLNSFPNTRLFGYVHTLTATRPRDAVMADIRKYANWEAFPKAAISVTGIFFDEAPDAFSSATSAYMSAMTDFARTTLGADQVQVIFNPGVVVDPRFYEMADLVVAVENFHSEVSHETIARIPKGCEGKSAMLLHHCRGSLDDMRDLVLAARESGIQCLFLSDAEYDSWSSAWTEFCRDVANAQ